MKTISGSTYQKNCHRWKKYLYLVIDYRDPVCTRQCLGIHGASQCKIRYLMQNVLLHKNIFFPMGAHRFIWCHIQSNNFKNFLLPKVSERASLQIPMTLESTVSPANFDHRFTDCFKGDISPLNDNLKRQKVNVCHPDGEIRLKKYVLVLIMGHSF